MLSFEDVTLSIGDKKILDRLSFDVLPGELVAVLGASGAGKSSVFRLLVGETRPSSGTVRLDAYALEEFTLKNLQKYRRQIGIVFQNFRLLKNKTVFENVAFALEVCGKEHLIGEKVPALLELVGLQQKSDQFPPTLSGGESQRAAIARALVHDPQILIADEPTGNLDPKNSQEIAILFRKLNQEQKLTIIFATHDPIMIKNLSPRVIRLEDGRILFDEQNCPIERVFEGIM